MSKTNYAVVIAAAVLIWLFQSNGETSTRLHGIGTAAFAVDQGAGEQDNQYVFTASQDGRKIYMWKRQGTIPPKFMGVSDAVLSE